MLSSGKIGREMSVEEELESLDNWKNFGSKNFP